MRLILRNGFLLLAVVFLGAEAVMAQRFRGAFGAAGGTFAPTFASSPVYGGFGFPFFAAPYYGYQLPNYWWVSPYPLDDTRQPGYNPSAGYEWDSVGALILTTYPANARVTLNGIFVGTANDLGPFQLPPGQHTIRLTAEGFEPSEHIVNVEQPGPLFLDVHLQRSRVEAKPGPQL
jgi:hypothetical protein